MAKLVDKINAPLSKHKTKLDVAKAILEKLGSKSEMLDEILGFERRGCRTLFCW